MSDDSLAWRSGEDIQLLDNALADTPLAEGTRAAMLRRASATLLAAGGAGALIAACGSASSGPSSSVIASATLASRTTSPARGTEIKRIIDTAVTAEALAVTYLSAVIRASSGTPVERFAEVLRAANAAEYDHYRALLGLGAKPIATRFWVPRAFFGSGLAGVFPTLQVAETLFVNAYLIAITAFAQAGRSDLVRYASEIAGVEAQHLALARYAGGMLPNDIGFAGYSIGSIDGIVAALERAGVGFGARGSAPGGFVRFAPPSRDVLVAVNHTTPR